MSFATNFLRVERGIWQHIPTGMLVHEVYNLSQLVAANGVLVFWDDDDTYAVAAGRTLSQLMKSSSVVTLGDIPQMMNFSYTATYEGSVVSNSTSYAGVSQMRQVANTLQLAVPTKIARVFAIVTNAYDGFKPRNVVVGAGFADVPILCPFNVRDAGSITPVLLGNTSSRLVAGVNTAHIVMPHFIARLANAKKYEDYVASLRASIDQISRDEVASWFDGTVVPRLARFKSALPSSLDIMASFIPTPEGAKYANAQRITASTQWNQGVSPFYAPMYRGGSWLMVPKPLCADGFEPFCAASGPFFSYTLSLVGSIGATPMRNILGGVAGTATVTGNLSVDTLIAAATKGLVNLAGDLGTPVQNVGELDADYVTRINAAVPNYRTSKAARHVMAPNSDYPGSVGWQTAFAALALNENAMLGELFSIIAAYNNPSVPLINAIRSLSMNEGDEAFYLGVNLWGASGNLEGYSRQVVGYRS